LSITGSRPLAEVTKQLYRGEVRRKNRKKAATADFIITRDARAFTRSAVRSVSPADYLRLISAE